MNPKTKVELESKIIELEYEITQSIMNGHKPFHGDYLEPKRIELQMLRCVVFGYESQYCNRKK